MKTSTLKQKINRLLKFLGIRIVLFKRARKPRATAAKRGPDSWDLKEGQTHSYNDGCPEHSDLTDTCERPRVEQPKSNPDITGPTS